MSHAWARAVLVSIIVAGCSSGGGNDAELFVFAASSLTGAFGAVEARFESSHPDVDVVFNFGPSDGLAAQIQSEGTADVFASASTRWMDEVAADPGVTDRLDFVQNRLVIVTPADDPAGISALADLAASDVQIVLAVEGVPVGDYAREALANAGILDAVTANVVSNEEDAAGVVAKISSGEADAGIVYVSDVTSTAGDDLRSLVIPADVNVVAIYPIAVVQGSDKADLADEFLELVVSREGRRILEEHGFEAPG